MLTANQHTALSMPILVGQRGRGMTGDDDASYAPVSLLLGDIIQSIEDGYVLPAYRKTIQIALSEARDLQMAIRVHELAYIRGISRTGYSDASHALPGAFTMVSAEFKIGERTVINAWRRYKHHIGDLT